MHIALFAALIVSIGPVDKAAPNRQPQMAASRNLTAIVFGGQNAIWFAASKDNAQSFSKPVQVASMPALALGRHRGPHIVIAGKTIVVSAIDFKTGDLMAWRSEDEGRTWSAPVVIDDVPAAAHEGLHAMAADQVGVLAAAWLDLRTKGTRLYGAYSKDAGATWSKNVLLFESPEGTICQCCAPSLAASDDGTFQVMFRNVADGNRDMYLLPWKAGTQPGSPKKMGQGAWHLNACPMDGGGVVNVNGKIVSAWRRDETVFMDQAGQPESKLGDGKDIAIAATNKDAYVSWTGANGIQLYERNKSSLTDLGKGAFSTLLALPNGQVAIAWEQDGGITIRAVE